MGAKPKRRAGGTKVPAINLEIVEPGPEVHEIGRAHV